MTYLLLCMFKEEGVDQMFNEIKETLYINKMYTWGYHKWIRNKKVGQNFWDTKIVTEDLFYKDLPFCSGLMTGFIVRHNNLFSGFELIKFLLCSVILVTVISRIRFDFHWSFFLTVQLHLSYRSFQKYFIVYKLDRNHYPSRPSLYPLIIKNSRLTRPVTSMSELRTFFSHNGIGET